MTDLLMIAVGDALREAAGARAKFPGNRHMVAATGEEFGELCNALLEHDRGAKTAADVYAEAIQLAAMALRIAAEGSLEFPKYRPNANDAKAFSPTTPKVPATPIAPDPKAVESERADQAKRAADELRRVLAEPTPTPPQPMWPYPNPGWPYPDIGRIRFASGGYVRESRAGDATLINQAANIGPLTVEEVNASLSTPYQSAADVPCTVTAALSQVG